MEDEMAEMSNAQAALLAATTRWSGIHGPKGLVEDVVLPEADKYLTWLEEKDAEHPPWPVRLASPEVAARYADVGDDEDTGSADRGLPR